MKEREELLARLGLQECVLIHYDIREMDVRCRTAVNRFLFGRLEVRTKNGTARRYHYPGLVDQGAVWIGQSVVLADPDQADRIITKFRELRVRFWTRTVYEPR